MPPRALVALQCINSVLYIDAIVFSPHQEQVWEVAHKDVDKREGDQALRHIARVAVQPGPRRVASSKYGSLNRRERLQVRISP